MNHFARQAYEASAPVRYAAVDPNTTAAIRNYLMINTRAHGLPQLHQQALPQLQPVYHAHPQIAPHFQGIMEGDHAALAQYLDLLTEHGDRLGNIGSRGRLGIMHPNTPPIGAHHDLLDWLAQLQGATTPETGHQDAMTGHNIHTMYAPAALEHPSTRRLVHHEFTPLHSMLGLLGNPNLSRKAPEQQVALRPYLYDLLAGGTLNPLSLLGAHDVLSGIADDPRHDDPDRYDRYPQVAGSGAASIASLLRSRLIPHLAENFG